MGHTWKKGSNRENGLGLENMVDTLKKGSHLAMGKEPHLEKLVTLRKEGHTLKNGSMFKKESHFKNWVILKQMP